MYIYIYIYTHIVTRGLAEGAESISQTFFNRSSEIANSRKVPGEVGRLSPRDSCRTTDQVFFSVPLSGLAKSEKGRGGQGGQGGQEGHMAVQHVKQTQDTNIYFTPVTLLAITI